MSRPALRRILLVACFIICVRLEHVESIPPNFGNLEHDHYSVKYLDDEIFGSGSTGKQMPFHYGSTPAVNPRLPNETEPIHYDIEISTMIHTGRRDFYGNVSIEVKVTANTKAVVLHSANLVIFNLEVVKEKQPLRISYTQDFSLQQITIRLSNPRLRFWEDDLLTISIQYNGTLRGDMKGFYVSTYKDKDNNDRYLATTQFESTSARFAFPCFDEPSRRATFAITIKHDPSYFALSNMPEDTNRSSAGITVFQRTLKMPTYLVAFIVSDFKSTGSEIDSVPHRIFSRSGTEHNQRFALNTSMEVLKSLSEYFGVRYAMPKMDLVAVPDFFAGAMENWGLCTFQERFLLFNNHSSTIHEQFKIANIIAHELVHQWFGNHVTIKWWDTLWLKEGFATLYAYEIIEKIYPEWDSAHHFCMDVRSLMIEDATESSRPMTYYVASPREIDMQYDHISYTKAAMMLSTWQHALGIEVFKKVLNSYLRKNQFGAATGADFFRQVKEVNQETSSLRIKDIANAMSSWTNQAGYPILFVKRIYNGTIILYQKRFYLNATLKSKELWHIPINFATKSNPGYNSTRAMLVMASSEQAIEPNVPNDDWIIFNKKGTALYRVNYDDRNWALLTQALKENPSQFHNINRGQMLDDAYRFAITKRLNHAIVMELITYLPKETHNFPWSMAKIILLDMNRFLKHHEKYKSFKEFVINLVSGIYKKVGVNEDPSESVHQKLLRINILQLACTIGMQQCLNDTKRKLIDYTRNAVEIEPNLRKIVYCHGLAHAFHYDFNFMLNEFLNFDNAIEHRDAIFNGLLCANREGHIRKLVETALNNRTSVSLKRRTALLSSAYRSGPVGRVICMEAMKKHWKEYNKIVEVIPNTLTPVEHFVDAVSEDIFDENEINEILKLVDELRKAKCRLYDFVGIIKSKQAENQKLLQDNGDEFMNWFLKTQPEYQINSMAPVHIAPACLCIITLIVISI